MKAVYLEAGKRPVSGRPPRGAAAPDRDFGPQERLLVRVQEAVGGVLGLTGFLLLMGTGGAEEITAILGLGVTGLSLMVPGGPGWPMRSNGQEAKAEWLRRMRERDGDE